jgi:hypothetical protein
MAPNQQQFKEKIAIKDDTGFGQPWFSQSVGKDTTVEVPALIPFLPYLAYDALTQDIPAHKLWDERVKCADKEGMELKCSNLPQIYFCSTSFQHPRHKVLTVLIS